MTDDDNTFKQKLRLIDGAIELLQKSTGYPEVMVKLMDGAGAIDKRFARKLETSGTPCPHRLKFAIAHLDNIAGCYINLVSDIPTRSAFEAILGGLDRIAWAKYLGDSDHFTLSEPVRKSIEDRIFHWRKESWQRLVTSGRQTASNERTLIQEPDGALPAQRSGLQPRPDLLKNTHAISLSRLQTAECLAITPRSIDRWIRDKKLTPIGTGTRKRFAIKEIRRLFAERFPDIRDV